MKSSTAVVVVLALILVSSTDGQDRQSDFREVTPSPNYARETTVIEDLLTSLVGLVRDIATDASASGISSTLHDMTSRLSSITDRSNSISFEQPSGNAQPKQLRADELAQLDNLLRDLVDQMAALRHELHIEGKKDLASRTEAVESQLLDGLSLVRTLRQKQENDVRGDDESSNDSYRMRADPDRSGGYLSPGRYDEDDELNAEDRQQRDEWEDDGWKNDDSWRKDDNWNRGSRRRHYRRSGVRSGSSGTLATYVGEFRYGWPFKENGVYRPTPAIRYNRVDGLVLGVRKLPLAWDSWERATIYGHGGYAIASRRWQYELGAETRLGTRGAPDFDLKVGGSYRRATTTDDLWKSSWLENSLGALLFNYDFFDYYETEGFTGYASLRLTPFVQVTGGYRSEDYRSLMRETSWSLFGGDNFTFNPPVVENRMNTALVVVEGGSVRDYGWLARGGAFRVEAELGQGLGGDFDFNRVIADGRVYLPMGGPGTLALRVRGGVATGDVPIQKAFRIGGVGSVRAYGQNAYAGSRMLVGNAEYTFAQDWIWDDFTVSVFADGGWLNSPQSNAFKLEDVFPTAGVGVGLLDQSVRVELAWPLDKDVAGTSSPSLWLRLAPSF